MTDEYRYGLIMYWSEEDNAFVAEIPELPGCAADGETYQETLANVQVAIGNWIDTARELGRSIPKPRGRSIYEKNLPTNEMEGSSGQPGC